MFSIVVACVSLCGNAQQEMAAPLFSTFLGKQLTQESLPLLAPPLPPTDVAKVRAWINSSHEMLQELIRFEKPVLRIPFLTRRLENGQEISLLAENFVEQKVKTNEILSQRFKVRNKSSYNYIFDIPETNYVAQIAGPLRRGRNLLIANDPNPEAPTLQYTAPQLWDDVIIRWCSTCQTVSRLATYLRAKEAVERFHLDKITLPATYIIGLDENLPGQVNDDNSLIIQEKIEKAYPVRIIFHTDRARVASPEAVRQVAIVIIYALIWDVDANLLIHPSTKNFVISDFEQYDKSNPNDFFMKNDYFCLHMIRRGLSELRDLFMYIPVLDTVCQRFVQLTDDQLKQIAAGTLPDSIANRLD